MNTDVTGLLSGMGYVLTKKLATTTFVINSRLIERQIQSIRRGIMVS
jgi:hypothetical protein